MSYPNKTLNTYSQSLSGSQTLPFNWPVVGMLLFLTGIPGIPAMFLIAMVLFVVVSSGGDATQSIQSIVDPLHLGTPAAIVVHGGAGILFFLTMPFQFSPRLRKKHLKWHRAAGLVAVVSAFIMAISGVWMHHVLSPGEFGMRYISLVIMSIAICAAFALGLSFIFKRNIAAHHRWMARGVAIALAAVTPLFVDIVIMISFSYSETVLQTVQKLQYEYGRLLAIALNLCVLEWVRVKKQRKAASQKESLHKKVLQEGEPAPN